MSLIDRLRRRPTPVADDEFSPMPGFRIEYGEETQFTVDPDVLALMRSGQAQRTAQEQFYVLDMLAEEGRAAVLDDGFVVPAEEIARLDDDEARVLNLPKRFTGKIIATTHRWTASPGFRIELELQIGAHPSPVRRRGPVVKVDGTLYRVSVPLLRALQAIDDHRSLEESRRTESENVRLVARLQAAQRLATASRDAADRDPTFDLPLGSLDHFTTVSPCGSCPSVGTSSTDSSVRRALTMRAPRFCALTTRSCCLSPSTWPVSRRSGVVRTSRESRSPHSLRPRARSTTRISSTSSPTSGCASSGSASSHR